MLETPAPTIRANTCGAPIRHRKDAPGALVTPASITRAIQAARVHDIARRTPLERAAKLSERLGHEVYLKREDLQPVFAFKIRGAYNRMRQLSPAERAAGVVCVSAGNHAQGVAYSARELGIEATVVMPVTASPIKLDAVRRLGARVLLQGDDYFAAERFCEEWVAGTGQTLIHPFDDPEVIAGQGTIGLELLADLPQLDAVFVPVGGGGLVAGIGAYLKTLRPSARVIAVQAAESAAMERSLAAGERVTLQTTGSFADGVAVKRVGKLTYALARQVVDEVVTVSTDEICAAIEAVHVETRVVLEPAGALAVAGLVKRCRTWPEGRRLQLSAINSGANMSFRQLSFVTDRLAMSTRS
jgi:threonine dehydratase